MIGLKLSESAGRFTTSHRQGAFDIEGGRRAGQSRRSAARAGLPRQGRVALRDRRTER